MLELLIYVFFYCCLLLLASYWMQAAGTVSTWIWPGIILLQSTFGTAKLRVGERSSTGKVCCRAKSMLIGGQSMVTERWAYQFAASLFSVQPQGWDGKKNCKWKIKTATEKTSFPMRQAHAVWISCVNFRTGWAKLSIFWQVKQLLDVFDLFI